MIEKKKILVVDNTTSIVSPWKNSVRLYFNPIEVIGGFEAISKLKQIPDIKCVIINLSLPGFNGLDVVIKIRELFKTIPIIVIAQKNDIRFIKNASSYGIHGYLITPFTGSQMLELLAKITKVNLAEIANQLSQEEEAAKKKKEEEEKKKEKELVDIPQLYYDGQSFLAREEIDEAIQTFMKIIKTKRLKDTWRRFVEDSYFQLGRCYIKKNELKKAIELFSLFIQKAPNSDNHKNAYLLIGECYEKMNNPEKALTIYKRIINMPPIDSVTTQARKRIKKLENH